MIFEEYLKGFNEKYYVSDFNLENAKIVIFQAYPPVMDLEAKAPVASLKTWHGIDLFDEKTYVDEARIGTAYISNFPLYPIDKETEKLIDDFEALRHSPRVESEYLRQQFKRKMEKIIENPKTTLVAYKLEMFERFYKDFLITANCELVGKLQKRIEAGTLKILKFPSYRIEQIKAFEKCYNEFKIAFDEIFKQ